jgi:exosortase/archaeosortase family protein
VPVAVLANLVRVTALVLATYYGGDALGQALHDYVGYAEIVLALGTFLLLDHIARLGWRLASSP